MAVSTEVKFDQDARGRVLRGLDLLSNAIKATLGPTERNVLIKRGFGGPRIGKDGVTVAKSIQLADEEDGAPSARRSPMDEPVE